MSHARPTPAQEEAVAALRQFAGSGSYTEPAPDGAIFACQGYRCVLVHADGRVGRIESQRT